MHTDVETGSNSQGGSPSLATVMYALSWGGSTYPAYAGRMEDVAGAGAVGGGGGGDATGGGAAGGASDTGSTAAASTSTDTGASSASGGNQTASPAAGAGATGATGATGAGSGTQQPGASNPNDANIRALRENYERLKPWETAAGQIKDPSAALAAHNQIIAFRTEGEQLAAVLGYTKESFMEAFSDDPVGTLAHLRGEQAKLDPTKVTQKQIEEMVKKGIQPAQEFINKQQTEAAIRMYDGEFNRLMLDDKVGFGKDAPTELRDAMYELTNMLCPDEAVSALKTSGKLAGVQQAFNAAKAKILAIVNAANAMQTQAASRGSTGAGGGARQASAQSSATHTRDASKLTLDDIINDASVLPGIKNNAY